MKNRPLLYGTLAVASIATAILGNKIPYSKVDLMDETVNSLSQENFIYDESLELRLIKAFGEDSTMVETYQNYGQLEDNYGLVQKANELVKIPIHYSHPKDIIRGCFITDSQSEDWEYALAFGLGGAYLTFSFAASFVNRFIPNKEASK